MNNTNSRLNRRKQQLADAGIDPDKNKQSKAFSGLSISHKFIVYPGKLVDWKLPNFDAKEYRPSKIIFDKINNCSCELYLLDCLLCSIPSNMCDIVTEVELDQLPFDLTTYKTRGFDLYKFGGHWRLVFTRPSILKEQSQTETGTKKINKIIGKEDLIEKLDHLIDLKLQIFNEKLKQTKQKNKKKNLKNKKQNDEDKDDEDEINEDDENESEESDSENKICDENGIKDEIMEKTNEEKEKKIQDKEKRRKERKEKEEREKLEKDKEENEYPIELTVIYKHNIQDPPTKKQVDMDKTLTRDPSTGVDIEMQYPIYESTMRREYPPSNQGIPLYTLLETQTYEVTRIIIYGINDIEKLVIRPNYTIKTEDETMKFFTQRIEVSQPKSAEGQEVNHKRFEINFNKLDFKQYKDYRDQFSVDIYPLDNKYMIQFYGRPPKNKYERKEEIDKKIERSMSETSQNTKHQKKIETAPTYGT